MVNIVINLHALISRGKHASMQHLLQINYRFFPITKIGILDSFFARKINQFL